MTEFYYYDSSFYAAVLLDTILLFDFHSDVPDQFYLDFPDERLRKAAQTVFFISHIHSDHYTGKVFDLLGDKAVYIADRAVGNPKGLPLIPVEPGSRVDLGDIRVSVFGSTDEGVSFGVTVGGVRIFHAGDLNLWHWTGENTEEEEKEARDWFERELEKVAAGFPCPDYAMFPVDGRMNGNYSEGAEEFIRKVRPRVFLPMHFWKNWEIPRAFAEKRFQGTKTAVIRGYGKIDI